jgi:hypothetical protein
MNPKRSPMRAQERVARLPVLVASVPVAELAVVSVVAAVVDLAAEVLVRRAPRQISLTPLRCPAR